MRQKIIDGKEWPKVGQSPSSFNITGFIDFLYVDIRYTFVLMYLH